MSIVDIIENTTAWTPLPTSGGLLEWEHDIPGLSGIQRLEVSFWTPLGHMSESLKIIWSDGRIENQRQVQIGAIALLQRHRDIAGAVTFRTDEFSTERRDVVDMAYIDDELLRILTKVGRRPPERWAVLVK